MHCVVVRNEHVTQHSRLQSTNWKGTRCMVVNRPHIGAVAVAPWQWRRRLMPTDVRQTKFNNYWSLPRPGERNLRTWMTAANASCNDHATMIDSPTRFCREVMAQIASWLIDVLIPITVHRRSVEDPTCPDIIISGWLIRIQESARGENQ